MRAQAAGAPGPRAARPAGSLQTSGGGTAATGAVTASAARGRSSQCHAVPEPALCQLPVCRGSHAHPHATSASHICHAAGAAAERRGAVRGAFACRFAERRPGFSPAAGCAAMQASRRHISRRRRTGGRCVMPIGIVCRGLICTGRELEALAVGSPGVAQAAGAQGGPPASHPRRRPTKRTATTYADKTIDQRAQTSASSSQTRHKKQRLPPSPPPDRPHPPTKEPWAGEEEGGRRDNRFPS